MKKSEIMFFLECYAGDWCNHDPLCCFENIILTCCKALYRGCINARCDDEI